jgi:nucleotide-binding universal stress UspA family protein
MGLAKAFGTHGPHTKEALGAVSENITRAAPRPVAVAPRGYRSDGGFVAAADRGGLDRDGRGRGRRAVDRALATLGADIPMEVHARAGQPSRELVSGSRAMDPMVLGSRG